MPQYSKALDIPDEEIGTLWALDIYALVLVAWRALGGMEFTRDLPTQHQIKRWVERMQGERGELKLYDDKQWKRAWEDPFIAALFRG